MSENSCFIYKVCYEKTETTKRISHVKARVKENGTSHPEKQYAKHKVIKFIDNNYIVKTRIEITKDNFVDGAPVIVVAVNGTKYIKTEANADEEDNLGALPTFEAVA